MLGRRGWIGVQDGTLLGHGERIGALCLPDPRPRAWGRRQGFLMAGKEGRHARSGASLAQVACRARGFMLGVGVGRCAAQAIKPGKKNCEFGLS